jgi:hypothetical protein
MRIAFPALALLLCLETPPLRLPDSPAARSFAGVGAETAPHELDEFFAAAPWIGSAEPQPAEVWTAWAEWLAAEVGAERVDPAHRAGLTWIACRQQRWEDAWRHFERLGGHPDWQAAVAPWLLPGTPPEVAAGPGGRATAIPSGTLLRPALPPAPAPERPGRLAPRTAALDGVRIGDAVCDLVLEVEAGGVTLEVFHRSGGSGLLIVDLPLPPDAEVFVDYVDWDRQEIKGAPLELLIEPREEEYTIYRRFKFARTEFPATPEPGVLPAAIERHGLDFVVAESADLEAVRAVGAACAGLLAIPVRVQLEADLAGERIQGTAVHFAAGAGTSLQAARVASAVEAFLLEAQD